MNHIRSLLSKCKYQFCCSLLNKITVYLSTINLWGQDLLENKWGQKTANKRSDS
jgi:hypothetical protein